MPKSLIRSLARQLSDTIFNAKINYLAETGAQKRLRPILYDQYLLHKIDAELTAHRKTFKFEPESTDTDVDAADEFQKKVD